MSCIHNRSILGITGVVPDQLGIGDLDINGPEASLFSHQGVHPQGNRTVGLLLFQPLFLFGDVRKEFVIHELFVVLHDLLEFVYTVYLLLVVGEGSISMFILLHPPIHQLFVVGGEVPPFHQLFVYRHCLGSLPVESVFYYV